MEVRLVKIGRRKSDPPLLCEARWGVPPAPLACFRFTLLSGAGGRNSSRRAHLPPADLRSTRIRFCRKNRLIEALAERRFQFTAVGLRSTRTCRHLSLFRLIDALVAFPMFSLHRSKNVAFQ